MTKIKVLLLLFVCAYLLILTKLFYIQIINPHPQVFDSYLKTDKISPERGRIYDRNNNPLVLNQNSYRLFIEPKKIVNKKEIVKKIDDVLKLGEATIEGRINDSKEWVAIASGIEEDKKNSILRLNLKGVGFEYGTKRYYTEASLAAHLIGFVGKDEKSEETGYFGLEGYYDKDLKGLPGILESERDLLGKPMFIGRQEKVDQVDGRDLLLTIDKTVQEISKRKLIQGIERYKAKQGCIITADPYTMQILGLVCLPDYDVDKFYEFSEEYFKNPSISDLYEPGSIFKPLIVASAIDEKKVKPNDSFDEKGPVQIGGYQIKTWNDKYVGKTTVINILERSSNVGMVFVGEKMGNDLVYKTLEKYGLNEKTGIDLQGEVSAYLRPRKDWYPIDFATVTFGQGIAITPIQMIRAFSSVINGGLLLRPYVVYKIISQQKIHEIKPKVEKRVICEQTSAIMRKMLLSVVENGEFKWTKPKGYKIGGKTGTAQIPIAGKYDPSKTVASFIGFAPYNKPKFISLVVLKQPEASSWASETAAPIFFEMANELLTYYNIAPEQ